MSIRSLRIEKVPSTTLYCIKWNGGGEIPKELSGTYTSMHLAREAMDIWKKQNDRVEVVEESPTQDVVKQKFEQRRK